MVKKTEDIEVLVALYLRGEATPEQAMQLEDWKSESEVNAAYYRKLEQVHASLYGKEVFKAPDTQAAWKKVAPQAEKKKGRIIPIWRTRQFYVGAAAMALLVLIIGTLWNDATPIDPKLTAKKKKEQPDVQPTVLLARNEAASFTLADNSKVNLEEGSELRVARDFNQKGRNLYLKGSGRFEVIHNEKQPFIIEVEGLKVVDVGTVFSIKTLADTVKVVVTEGAVELRLNNKLVEVAAGDSAFYVISQEVVSRYKQPETRQDKVFQFNGTKLHEVVKVLGEFFDRKIVIMDEAIDDCSLTVTFKNENLATILDIIRELLDIRIERKNDTIELYGEGCI